MIAAHQWLTPVIGPIIIGLSAFAAGFALYLSVVNLWAWHKGRDPIGWAYACARLGTAITVFLVAEALARSPVPIEPTGRAVLYAVGLLLAAVGLLGIAQDHRRHQRH